MTGRRCSCFPLCDKLTIPRGSALVSRIANYFPNDPRFVGFGFMALSYFMPTPEFDISAFGEITKAFGGKEIFGYWGFFAEENAGKVIDAHVSFFNICSTFRY